MPTIESEALETEEEEVEADKDETLDDENTGSDGDEDSEGSIEEDGSGMCGFPYHRFWWMIVVSVFTSNLSWYSFSQNNQKFNTMAIRTTVVPIRILIRTTVVPVRILFRTTAINSALS